MPGDDDNTIDTLEGPTAGPGVEDHKPYGTRPEPLPYYPMETIRGLDLPDREPWDPAPWRELVRGALAFSLVALLWVLVIGPLFLLATQKASIDDLKELLTVVFTPLVGLVGAATGFYYGTRK